MITYIVIDTGYLLELFRVPKRFNESNANEVKRRFSDAKTQLHNLYIPVPVLFELANHIAHVDNGYERLELANKFSKTVQQGIDLKETFINIIPCEAFATASELSNCLESFSNQYVQQGLSLTDSAVILEAKSLKKPHNSVHIWTTEGLLKSYEPDAEPDPFIGNRK